MSENKKDRNLPGKDYYHNQKQGGKNSKRKKLNVSDEERLEFAAAFGDEEESPTVNIPPVTEKEKAENIASDKKSENEDLYSVPEFDSDKFFETLGFNLNGKDNSATLKQDKISETKHIKMQEHKTNAERKAPEDTLSSTKHFNLRSKTRKIQLDKNKKSFMQNFRVLSRDKEDRAIIEAAPVGKGGKAFADSIKPKKGEDIFEAVEKAYLNKDDVTQIKIENTALRKERNMKGAEKAAQMKKDALKQIEREKSKLLIYGVIFAVVFILTVFFNEKSFYPPCCLIASAIIFLMSFSSFKSSFKALKSLSAVPETALALMNFFVFIHNITMYSLEQAGSIYTICAVLACFMSSFASYYKLKSRVRLINMATKSKELSILQRIAVKNDVAYFASNVEGTDEPDIFYCAKAFLDVGIEEPEGDKEKENKRYVFSMSLVLLASLIVGLLCFSTQLTGISFISALTATVCLLLPVLYDPISRYEFYRRGRSMLKQGACISGREALSHISSSDGFVLDARDVFAADISRFRKSAVSKIAQNDSAVFAAALLNEAGSVLAPCFDSFIKQMNIELPEVENFQYEERLGYSAWVVDRKILVGNRQMLLNHSITVPSKEHEKAYGKNKFVMYVVVDGEISATFLVSYKVLSSLRKYSQDFNKTGLVLMLSSKEAFLNEEIVSAKLSLDISSVKVLSSKATAIMDRFNSSIEQQAPTGLLCSAKKRSIMHLIMECYSLTSSDKLIRYMIVLGQVLGFILLVLSPILKIPALISPITIVILRLIWLGIIDFIIERRK